MHASASDSSLLAWLSVPTYLPAGGPPVPALPRCLNSATLKDVTDSSRDEGCYGYPKTDAHSDRCPAACVVGIRLQVQWTDGSLSQSSSL